MNGTTCDYDSSKYGSPQLVLKRLHEFEQSDLLWLRALVEYADSCKLNISNIAVYVFVAVIELFYFIVEFSDCHAINVNTGTSMFQRLSIAIAYEEEINHCYIQQSPT